MAHNRLAQQLGVHKLADTSARSGGIIGDHGEIALVLADDLVNEAFGRAHRHEAADHQACAVGNHVQPIGREEESACSSQDSELGHYRRS